MGGATAAEREAFSWMQGRMVELLLRHDVARFGRTFAERRMDDAASDPHLARYRDLAVLFHLRDDLFESILPRIKRRLSFAAPREVRVEGLPPRGRIDWSRTAAASWHDYPDEVPLEVYTRQRRRHFATPENLLTVVTLLEYRNAVQALLEIESAGNSCSALQHPFHDIVTACNWELVFPQFVGLVSDCQDIISGHGKKNVADLESDIASNLLPGRNSAYDDLLAWRKELRMLRLLDRTADLADNLLLGADPARDNYLYQLWLCYELADFLEQQGRVCTWTRVPLRLTFRWGEDGDEREYWLQHDQVIPHTADLWPLAPGVRPDLYIARSDRAILQQNGQTVWREPGYVLDAKYYKPQPSPKAPADPLKRMVADIQLTDECRGGLLFAFHGSAVDAAIPECGGEADAEAISTKGDGRLYSVTPDAQTAQRAQPDAYVGIWRLQPRLDGTQMLRNTFRLILDDVHQSIKDPITVRCHAMFFDGLSTTAHGVLANVATLRQRSGAVFSPLPDGQDPVDDLLLCPKPHVAPWRIDLVSRTHDCLESSLCHIKHQPHVRKPDRLTALEAVEAAIRDTNSIADKEAVARAAQQQVLTITRRYADILKPDRAKYDAWIRDKLDIGDVYDTTPLLTDVQRETLVLARFLWEQLDHFGAANFAGPALLFTGVLEWATQKSIHKRRPTLYTADNVRLTDTLGTLGHCKEFGGANWPILQKAIVGDGYWNEEIDSAQPFTFSRWIDMVAEIVPIRNKAAHRANVDLEAFGSLTGTLLFGSPRRGLGTLNGLLLAWRPTRFSSP